jgi:stage III sporulation protein AB
LTQKDKDILKDLGKLLGQTDIDGQISQIKLVSNFLDIQIEEANKEKMKNQKLYRTLRNGGRSCYSYNISLKNSYLFNKLIKK